MDEELIRFKTDINLVSYAAFKGYRIDKIESCKACIIMRKDGSKIGISTASDGHGVYFDFRNEKGGSVIDFVKRETGKNLGQVRLELRPWISCEARKMECKYNYQKPEPSAKSRQQVAIEFAMTKIVTRHSYLESRHISRNTLESDTFKGKIRSDKYGNACFPHYNKEGLCGIEKKNLNYTGFSKGGEKGLWYSNYNHNDVKKMVICESAIDALSYHQLKGADGSFYFSVAGQLGQSQLNLIGKLIAKNGPNKRIVLAFDNDENGWSYVKMIQNKYESLVDIDFDIPPFGKKDWNDMLKHSIIGG